MRTRDPKEFVKKMSSSEKMEKSSLKRNLGSEFDKKTETMEKLPNGCSESGTEASKRQKPEIGNKGMDNNLKY